MNDVEVRRWYCDRCHELGKEMYQKIETLSRYAHSMRIKYRTEARDMMQNQSERKDLDKWKPNRSFDEIIDHKMKDKGLDRQSALVDIIFTSSTTNSEVDKEVLS